MKLSYKNLIVLLLVGMFCSIAMVTSAEPGKPVIYVLADRNITAETKNSEARNQMADWWEADLVNVLTKRGGYDAKLIQKQGDFVANPNSYLLTAKILDYNPGSKAARIMVGLGAGSCSMDIHFELFGADNKQVFAKDDHVASSRDWRNVARKLNENILKVTEEALNSK